LLESVQETKRQLHDRY